MTYNSVNGLKRLKELKSGIRDGYNHLDFGQEQNNHKHETYKHNFFKHLVIIHHLDISFDLIRELDTPIKL